MAISQVSTPDSKTRDSQEIVRLAYLDNLASSLPGVRMRGDKGELRVRAHA